MKPKSLQNMILCGLIAIIGVAASCSPRHDSEETELIEMLRQARGQETRDVQVKMVAKGESMIPFLNAVWADEKDPRMSALAFVTIAGIDSGAYVANLGKVKAEQVESLVSMLSKDALSKATLEERERLRAHFEPFLVRDISPLARANIEKLLQVLESGTRRDP